jgi:uncharacterized protein (DUF885 family)
MTTTMTRRTATGLMAGSMLAAPGALAGCATRAAAGAGPDGSAFARLSADSLDTFARLSPRFATWLGDNRFNDQLDDLSATGRASSAAARAGIKARLATIERSRLSPGDQVDAAILDNQLALSDWQARADVHAWDPTLYSDAAGGALYGLVAREIAPIAQRLAWATQRMALLPEIFAAARSSLDPARVPAVHAQTYARQHPGVMGLIDSVILPQAQALGPDDRARLQRAAETVRAAAKAHQIWIDDTLAPQARGDFRIGAKRYDEKLGLALGSPLTRTEIKARARDAAEQTRAEMLELAGKVLGRGAPRDPQAAIAAALERAYAERPARSDVVTFARQTLEGSTRFVREQNLITLPDTPVEIIIMPEFQRGVAVAYCDSPGPLAQGQKTFYAISPIPEIWTETQTTSFLREYNNRSIHELTIHEAMPGHYVQIWHSNRYKSVLRAAFYSGTFVEGWACYAQDMMGEEGYYGDDPLGGLVNRKWRLRLITNALLDQAIHADGMTREEGMALMTETAFQEEREAAGKWVRAQVSSSQLSTYFVGWIEHYALRNRARKNWGDGFSLKRYHDAILAFGSPPTHHVEALLFGETIKG